MIEEGNDSISIGNRYLLILLFWKVTVNSFVQDRGFWWDGNKDGILGGLQNIVVRNRWVVTVPTFLVPTFLVLTFLVPHSLFNVAELQLQSMRSALTTCLFQCCTNSLLDSTSIFRILLLIVALSAEWCLGVEVLDSGTVHMIMVSDDRRVPKWGVTTKGVAGAFLWQCTAFSEITEALRD